MLARLMLKLPFYLTVPVGELFPIHGLSSSDGDVRFRPPGRSDSSLPDRHPESITMDGREMFQADVLIVDFVRESFDRRTNQLAFDPSIEDMQDCVSWFLDRIRFVTRASHISAIDLRKSLWRVTYLQDDETEFQMAEGFVRSIGSWGFSVTYTRCDSVIWNEVFKLPLDFKMEVWDSLCLDAVQALPHIGSALVLAYTALEVFSAQICGELEKRSEVPSSLWDWIGERGDWYKEPNVEDRLDIFLKLFLGHSLKESQELWMAFCDLRNARNKFAHNGIPRIGKDIVTLEKAAALVASVQAIFLFIRNLLPDEMRWPVYEHTSRLEIAKRLT